MKLISSVCTNLYFPASRKSLEEFRRMAHFLSAQMGVDGIEFYHDGDGRDRVGYVLSDEKLSGVYIAVIPSKEKLLHLSEEDEAGRRAAVELMRGLMDEAAGNGITQFMFNSGRAGNDPEKGLAALKASVAELYEYNARRGYRLRFLLEPCDSGMEAMHLIGPSARTAKLLDELHGQGYPLRLTLDTAHTAEEFEDFPSVLKSLRQYCGHIHFANCVIRDKASLFFGDKHVGYEYPDTEWDFGALSGLFEELKALYPAEDELRIGLEVLCREDDPYAYFTKTWEALPYLHKSGGTI